LITLVLIPAVYSFFHRGRARSWVNLGKNNTQRNPKNRVLDGKTWTCDSTQWPHLHEGEGHFPLIGRSVQKSKTRKAR